jgi:hypothetical protein
MGLGHSPSIPTTDLALCLDPSNVKSYPGTGSTITDLSGNGNNFTLNGSPGFNYFGGGSLSYGGAQYLTSSFTPSNTWSMSIWFNNTSTYNIHNRGIFSTYAPATYNGCYVGTTTVAADSLRIWYNGNSSSLISYSFSINTWYNLTVTCNGTTLLVYVNGALVNTINTATTHASTLAIGQTRFDNNYWVGYLAQALVYSRAITAAEVAQIYSATAQKFTTPSPNLAGIVLNLDAGNTASYSGSGTTWTDLSGNGNNGTLTNGPTYNSGNGGYLLFDGSNDYVNVPYASSLDTPLGCCYEVWMYPTTATGAEFISRGTSDSGTYPDNPRLYCSSTGSIYFDWSRPGLDIYGDYLGATMNGWNQIVVNATPGDYMQLYINAAFKGNNQIGGVLPTPVPNNAYPIQIGGATWINRYLAGRIAVVRVYNRTLSALEIARNFDALRGRFGL